MFTSGDDLRDEDRAMPSGGELVHHDLTSRSRDRPGEGSEDFARQSTRHKIEYVAEVGEHDHPPAVVLGFPEDLDKALQLF